MELFEKNGRDGCRAFANELDNPIINLKLVTIANCVYMFHHKEITENKKDQAWDIVFSE